MTRKKKFDDAELAADDLKWYISNLAALETCDRGIKREQEDKAEAVKEWNGRIAELEKTRNRLLDGLEKFRLGERPLEFADGDGVLE